jgi:hypothetical protein
MSEALKNAFEQFVVYSKGSQSVSMTDLRNKLIGVLGEDNVPPQSSLRNSLAKALKVDEIQSVKKSGGRYHLINYAWKKSEEDEDGAGSLRSGSKSSAKPKSIAKSAGIHSVDEEETEFVESQAYNDVIGLYRDARKELKELAKELAEQKKKSEEAMEELRTSHQNAMEALEEKKDKELTKLATKLDKRDEKLFVQDVLITKLRAKVSWYASWEEGHCLACAPTLATGKHVEGETHKRKIKDYKKRVAAHEKVYDDDDE